MDTSPSSNISAFNDPFSISRFNSWSAEKIGPVLDNCDRSHGNSISSSRGKPNKEMKVEILCDRLQCRIRTNSLFFRKDYDVYHRIENEVIDKYYITRFYDPTLEEDDSLLTQNNEHSTCSNNQQYSMWLWFLPCFSTIICYVFFLCFVLYTQLFSWLYVIPTQKAKSVLDNWMWSVDSVWMDFGECLDLIEFIHSCVVCCWCSVIYVCAMTSLFNLGWCFVWQLYPLCTWKSHRLLQHKIWKSEMLCGVCLSSSMPSGNILI